jgi:hypothetical protein
MLHTERFIVSHSTILGRGRQHPITSDDTAASAHYCRPLHRPEAPVKSCGLAALPFLGVPFSAEEGTVRGRTLRRIFGHEVAIGCADAANDEESFDALDVRGCCRLKWLAPMVSVGVTGG